MDRVDLTVGAIIIVLLVLGVIKAVELVIGWFA